MSSTLSSSSHPGTLVEVRFADPVRLRGIQLDDIGCADSFSPQEQTRYERLRRIEDKEAYLAAHLNVRVALADMTHTKPHEWRIEADAEGRPIAAGPSAVVAPAISISHTRGLVACALSHAPAVGIDVEACGRKLDVMAMARRNLAPDELVELTGCPEPQHNRRFLEYWTLKEAYLKARGIGLRVSPREVAVELASGQVQAVRVGASLADGKRWDLRLLRAPDGYLAALAVALPALGDVEIRQRASGRAELLGHG